MKFKYEVQTTEVKSLEEPERVFKVVLKADEGDIATIVIIDEYGCSTPLVGIEETSEGLVAVRWVPSDRFKGVFKGDATGRIADRWGK